VTLRHLALTQQRKTIRELNNTKLSSIEALVSCIVLICLQNAQNERQSYQLLHSGEMMLHELDDQLSTGSVILSSRELEILENYIRPDST